MTADPLGPFDTEPHIPTSDDTASDALNRLALLTACRSAHVHLGAFDLRVVEWLAGYEPSTVQVVVGLIGRAYAAGQRVTEQEGPTRG